MNSSPAAPRAGRIALRTALVAAALLWQPAALKAQSSTAAALKAAFVYNFVKFTAWPRDVLSPGQQLSLCVVGEASIADALGDTIRSHTIDAHELVVTVVQPDAVVRSCHLLYVNAGDERRVAQVLALATSAPVLTVSDAAHFAERGGIAQLFVEGNRMRFGINVAAAERARLRLSSKLLSLAKLIEDGPHVN